MWSRLLVGCLLVGVACRADSDPVTLAVAGLRELSAATSVHRLRLGRQLRLRDDLGPGEYRNRLREATRKAVRALDLEQEARAARLLANAGVDLARLGAADRGNLEVLLPPGVALLGNVAAVTLLAHAYRAADEARRLRSRSEQSVSELRELRERVLDLRDRLARARLGIADSLRKLGLAQAPGRGEVAKLARAHRVRLLRVRSVREADDGRVVRRTQELEVEGEFLRIARLAGALAEGGELDRVNLSGAATSRGTLRVTYRGPRDNTVPLPSQEPSSSPSLLLMRLRDAEAWRQSLAPTRPQEPSLADLLLAVIRALPPGGQVTRFATEGDQFTLLLEAPRARAQKFVAQLAAQPGVDLVRPISSGSRLALRGRWRRVGGAPSGFGLEPLVLASAGSTRRRTPVAVRRADLPALPASVDSWTLAGVVSAADAAETRALLRDPGGRTVIVKVGSDFGLGYRVVQIGRAHVLARAGRRLVRIVSP